MGVAIPTDNKRAVRLAKSLIELGYPYVANSVLRKGVVFMSEVNPRIDLVFKKIFGVEENKDLLISLLNSILSKEDQISSVEILNPYNLQGHRKEKLSILDIKARGETGHYYNIEIQVTDANDYQKKALYYWAKLYTQQLAPKGFYKTLKKTIGIHILNFTSIPFVEAYHNTFHLQPDSGEKLEYFRDIELHTIELNKFGKESCVDSETEELRLLLPQIKTALDRWTAFISRFYLFKGDSLPQEMESPEIKKALESLEEIRFTDEEREIYESQLKWFRDESSALDKKGEVSFQLGREEGKEEVAQMCFRQGMSIEQISILTGFSPEKLEHLLRKDTHDIRNNTDRI